MPINTLEGIKEAMNNGGTGVFSGIIYFFYLVSKGQQQFILSMFLIHILISFYVGYITGIFVGPDIPYRDGIISLSGLGSISIIGILINKSKLIAEKYINATIKTDEPKNNDTK